MAVTKRTRYEVLKRDNYTCHYCRSTQNELTVDHLMPKSLGGSDKMDNLVACCKDCNAGKGSTAPDAEQVAELSAEAVKWAKAEEEVARQRRSQRVAIEAYISAFDELWSGWHVTYNGETHDIPRDDNWEYSVETWAAAGLTMEDFQYLVRRAMKAPKVTANNVWRYFCGCCWNEIKDRQDLARLSVDIVDLAEKLHWEDG